VETAASEISKGYVRARNVRTEAIYKQRPQALCGISTCFRSAEAIGLIGRQCNLYMQLNRVDVICAPVAKSLGRFGALISEL
jgi:hypothetical protein